MREDTPNINIYFKRHKINNIPEFFFCGELACQAIITCIETIENAQAVQKQKDIDIIYDHFCKVYNEEMDTWFISRNVNRGTKKRFRNSTKSFWNDELIDLWQSVVESENKYFACPQNVRQIYRTEYLGKQKLFDSFYSKAKRNFEREKLYNIERLNTENPREFCEAIKMLGPRKKTEIPMEVYDEQGHVNDDVKCVLNTWSKEDETLFKGYNVDDFDSAFYNFTFGGIERMESEENDDIDMWYNKDIDEKEVKFVLKKDRLKKAVGIDNIPFEVLKNSVSVPLLRILFSKILLSHVVPTIWRKAIVKPIPKKSTTDPRLPLQHC